jgi:AcrR family transcriptional regulator
LYHINDPVFIGKEIIMSRNAAMDTARMERSKQKVADTAFALFAEHGIESVTMPEIAKAAGMNRSSIYRYFPAKADLAVAVSAKNWSSYTRQNYEREKEKMHTAAERYAFWLDSFLDLYRNHSDLLRFNYNFNGYLRYEAGTSGQKEPYMGMVDHLGELFHEVYERGMRDGTLKKDVPEKMMFSSSFHIMLAAVTRYAVGLAYVIEGNDPEEELIMLEELLLSRFIAKP